VSQSERLTAGAVWQETLDALRPDFWTMFAVAAPFTLLVSMVVTLFGPPLPQKLEELTPQTLLILGLLPNVIGAIGQLAVARMVLRPGDTAGAALASGFLALPAWLGATLLTAVPLAIGLVLLIVPGLYLMARLFLVAPVIVVERKGSFSAIARSWKLTDDSAWQLVMLFVLAGLGLLGASLLAGGLGGAIGSVLMVLGSKGAADFAAALIPAVLSTVWTMASAAAAAVVYRQAAGPDPAIFA
jgi:hypothetical protein